MKTTLVLISFVFWSLTVFSQKKIPPENTEFSLVSSYYGPLGIFGAKFGYRPASLHRILQFNAGLGGGRSQSIRLSLGLSVFPTKELWVTPYLGADYGLALGTILGNEDTDELYQTGVHHYVCPYGAVRIRTWTPQLNVKLKLGYSQLLNAPNIQSLHSQGPGYARILGQVQSHWMLMVGVSSTLYDPSQEK